MNKQPDRLFADKLKEYQKPVSADVWHRVSVRLDEKKGTGLWFKVAAAILVLALAAILLFSIRYEAPPDLAENHAPQKELPVVKESLEPKIAEPSKSASGLPNEKTASKEKPINLIKKKKTTRQPTTPAQQEQTRLENQAQPLPVARLDIVTPVSDLDVRPEENVVANKNTPRVTFVYTAEEVNAKYLDKSSGADATSEKKKPSTFRKLLDKAYDLKHNQDPLGELRQKKNEIFAFNFKGEKQRGEN